MTLVFVSFLSAKMLECFDLLVMSVGASEVLYMLFLVGGIADMDSSWHYCMNNCFLDNILYCTCGINRPCGCKLSQTYLSCPSSDFVSCPFHHVTLILPLSYDFLPFVSQCSPRLGGSQLAQQRPRTTWMTSWWSTASPCSRGTWACLTETSTGKLFF